MSADQDWYEQVLGRIMTNDGVDRPTAARLYDERRAALNGERLTDIIQRGYSLGGVFGIEHLHGMTAYAFTMGNWTIGMPELLMTGSDTDTLGRMLGTVCDMMRAGTLGAFDHGDEIHPYPATADEDDMPLRVVRLDPERTRDEDWFNQLHGLRGEREPLWAYQIVWPGLSLKGAYEGVGWPTVDEPWLDQPIFGEVWW